ncbi:MAG: hypothetical protein ACYTXE_36470 [Nostoc sp.]
MPQGTQGCLSLPNGDACAWRSDRILEWVVSDKPPVVWRLCQKKIDERDFIVIK